MKQIVNAQLWKNLHIIIYFYEGGDNRCDKYYLFYIFTKVLTCYYNRLLLGHLNRLKCWTQIDYYFKIKEAEQSSQIVDA